MNNLEKLATLGTQDAAQDKQNNKHNTETKKMSNQKPGGEPVCLRRVSSFWLL
jgi:hypothetical protein